MDYFVKKNGGMKKKKIPVTENLNLLLNNELYFVGGTNFRKKKDIMDCKIWKYVTVYFFSVSENTTNNGVDTSQYYIWRKLSTNKCLE